MTATRIHISTLVNASKIRREKRNGRDVIVVPSATLPDNVVMNGIRYPAAVIADSYKSLEGTLAPLGHPKIGNNFVPAKSVEGLALGYIGAHNENVRRKDGRVYLDKVIDVKVASQSDGGKAVLNAIEKGDPIHTSTGLLATLKPLNNAEDGAKFEAETMLFDQDAILLDEPGAATPEQGVGMFVNAEGEEVEVINSFLEDDMDRDEMWAIESLLRAHERKLRAPLIERMKTAIEAIIRGGPEPEVTTNQEVSDVDKEQFDALSAKVDAFKPGLTAEEVGAVVANALAPLLAANEAREKADKEKAEAEHAVLVNKIVEAEILPETEAKAASALVLNALLEKNAAPKAAFRVNSRFEPASKNDRAALAPKGD